MAESRQKPQKVVLRYPYDAITDQTDYFQILISKYQAIGTNSGLTRGRGTTGTPTNLSASSRSRDGVIGNVEKTWGVTQANINQNKGNEKNNVFRGISARKIKNEQDIGLIYLPMPSNIQDGNSINFSEQSLDGLTAAVYGGIEFNPPTDNNKMINTLAATATNVASVLVGPESQKYFINKIKANAASIPFGGNLTFQQILAREEGKALNPNMELLFNGPTIRSFKFSFKMTPRSLKEANVIRAIIRTFKENMSPSGKGDTFLQTPNVFNLMYKRGRENHPYLNRFKTCALVDMSVNYTGENIYATYPDGSPVSYIMDLGFKELEPIYQEDYEDLKNPTILGY